MCLTDFCLFSLRSSRQNRCPDFQPICKEVHAPARFAKRALGRTRGLCEGIAGTCKQGLCGAHAFGFGRFGRSSNPAGTQPPGAGGLRAISGQSHAKRRVVRCALFCRVRAALLFGTRVLVSKRCFAPPRPGCRSGNARRFGRSGRSGRFGGSCDFAGLAGSVACGTNRGHPRNRRSPMPKPHARATRAISPGHLPMMVRLLARISRNDLHWLNTLDAQELRALLQLIATAKTPQYRDPA